MLLRLNIIFMLGHAIMAAKWAIDGSCDLVEIADPRNGHDPFLMATADLKEAMKEALTMAQSAFDVMKDHTADQHVSDMLRLILGDDATYQSKFDAVKQTFQNIMGFDKEPAPDRPLDKGWQSTMTSNDVMIFCSNDRFKHLFTSSRLRYDVSMGNTKYLSMEFDDDTKRGRCYATDYDAETIEGQAFAMTTPSDFFNKAEYLEAPLPRNPQDWMTPRPHLAFSIDVCTWYLHKSLRQGWPRIVKDRIMQVQQPGFIGGVTEVATPVDGLRNTGLMFLHELTHTHQGGRLRDVDNLPPGTPSCYGWKCAQDLKDPTNSDNVAMLGLALHLWTMGYYVDKDGKVKNN